jgi:hypothetical protein
MVAELERDANGPGGFAACVTVYTFSKEKKVGQAFLPVTLIAG